MKLFGRYPHVKELFIHYCSQEKRDDVVKILASGVRTEEEAEVLSRFAWKMAALINEDEEKGVSVLGSTDNTEMLPDLSYEMTGYFKSTGFYNIWKEVSNEEMN